MIVESSPELRTRAVTSDWFFLQLQKFQTTLAFVWNCLLIVRGRDRKGNVVVRLLST